MLLQRFLFVCPPITLCWGALAFRFGGEGLGAYVPAVVGRSRASALLRLFLFLLADGLVGDVERTLGTLQANALQSGLNLDSGRVDHLGFVDEFYTDLLGLVDASSGLGGDAGAEGAQVAAVDALPVLQKADEHLRSTVEDGLDVGGRDRGLIRDKFDELIKLHVGMEVDRRVPKLFSCLGEADFAFNGFDLDHDSLIYC